MQTAEPCLGSALKQSFRSSQSLLCILSLIHFFELVCSGHVRHVDLHKPGQVESHSERSNCNVQVHSNGDRGCSDNEQHVEVGDNRGAATWMRLSQKGALDVGENRLIVKDIVPNLQEDTTEH